MDSICICMVDKICVTYFSCSKVGADSAWALIHVILINNQEQVQFSNSLLFTVSDDGDLVFKIRRT